MLISQLLGFFVVDCCKAEFSSAQFAQALSVDSTLVFSAITRVSCLFSCSSLARPSFPFPPNMALNNFGVSCFFPKRLAKPRGCCTGGPGGGFPFCFSSTLETEGNKNTQQCRETEQSSCKAEMPHLCMKNLVAFIWFPAPVMRPKLETIKVLL